MVIDSRTLRSASGPEGRLLEEGSTTTDRLLVAVHT